MKVVRLKAPASVSNLQLPEEDLPVPTPGEVLVRIWASSLNPHDDFVIRGVIPTADGRIPLSDGAGEVLALGEGVTELKVGDVVVSTFWPYWLAGDMTIGVRRDIPGENLDGYAREYACMPAHAFTKAPPGLHARAGRNAALRGIDGWSPTKKCIGASSLGQRNG